MKKEMMLFAPEENIWGDQICVRDGYIDRFTGLQFLRITGLEMRSVERNNWAATHALIGR